MSNEAKRSPKRRKYSIESVKITPAENATVKSVMDRLMGRTEVRKAEGDTLGNPTAQSTLPAQTTLGSQPTQTLSPAQGSQTTLSRKPAQSKRPTLSRQTAQTEIAPTRDYMKAANSIVRDAIRHGLFKGKSKQLYDFLYSKTRGAIVPSLSIRLRRSELMKGSGIGSTHTLRDNLRHLRAVGLVSWQAIHGEQDGNVYSVHLPEEAHLPFDLDGNPVQVSNSDHSDHSVQKPLRPLSAETAQSAQSSSQAESTSSEESKTFSLRPETTIDDDDAALAGLINVFKEMAQQMTGKPIGQHEADRWRELAEVIAAEGKIAAGRTTVSSVPAFLAEHLRRRLWKIDKKQARAEGRELPDETIIAQPSEDTSKCPDCGGSGWWYPEGPERGVAKCKHEALSPEKSPEGN